MNEINDDVYICDGCGSDIMPECISAKQDGYEEGHRDAFKIIRNMFVEKKISRSNILELNVDEARKLLSAIHYAVNY